MLKAKITIKAVIEQDKIPAEWRENVKATFETLDNTMVYFGSESKGVMKIKEIKVEENKNKEENK